MRSKGRSERKKRNQAHLLRVDPKTAFWGHIEGWLGDLENPVCR